MRLRIFVFFYQRINKTDESTWIYLRPAIRSSHAISSNRWYALPSGSNCFFFLSRDDDRGNVYCIAQSAQLSHARTNAHKRMLLRL